MSAPQYFTAPYTPTKLSPSKRKTAERNLNNAEADLRNFEEKHPYAVGSAQQHGEDAEHWNTAYYELKRQVGFASGILKRDDALTIEEETPGVQTKATPKSRAGASNSAAAAATHSQRGVNIVSGGRKRSAERSTGRSQLVRR